MNKRQTKKQRTNETTPNDQTKKTKKQRNNAKQRNKETTPNKETNNAKQPNKETKKQRQTKKQRNNAKQRNKQSRTTKQRHKSNKVKQPNKETQTHRNNAKQTNTETMSKWPRLRLTKCVDDLTITYRRMNHTVATVITEAVSSMVGWLENGLDFHVSNDEEGVEGKSVVLVSDASLKASLTSSTKALGMRVVSHARILGIDAYGAGAARQRRTQYGRLTKIKKRMPKVKFYMKYGAVTSEIAKAGLMPSGLHGVRCMGMPPTRLKAFRTTIGRACQAKHAGRFLTWRRAVHQCDPTHPCRAEPIVAWAEAVWDEQLEDADRHKAWRRQQRLVCLEPAWSKVSGPTGAIIMCLRQTGWTWPHHTTFVVASGHEVDIRQIRPRHVEAQAAVDSELALWREWADNDERKELLPCPLLEPVVLANKRAQRRPQEDARGSEQGGNR